jgi:PAS domain S-box-containing protein
MFDPLNYNFSLYGILPLSVGVIMFLLGIAIFLQNKRSTVNVAYLFVSFIMLIWLSGIGIIAMCRHIEHALIWYNHYAFFGILMVGPSAYNFFLALTKKRLKIWASIIMFIMPVMYFVLNLRYKYALGGYARYFWSYYFHFTPAGLLVMFHCLLFYMVLLSVLLVRQWRQAKPGVERKRMNILLASTLFAQLGIIDLFPALGYEIYACGYIFLFVWAVCLCWMIVKYKFMIISPERVAKQILNLSPNFLLLADLDGHILGVNKFVETALGYSLQELRRKPLKVIVRVDDLHEMLPQLMKEGHINNIQTTFTAKSGQTIPVLFSAILVPTGKVAHRGMVCVAQDISELQKSQEELSIAYQELQSAQANLVHAEKMASVGTLAAGLAHEIHLPLASLNVALSQLTDDFSLVPRSFHRYDQMLHKDTNIDPETKESVYEELQQLKDEHNFSFIGDDIYAIINESLEGIYRIENIVVNLKNFSKPDKGQREDVDLNKVIEQALYLVDNQIRYKCVVSKGYTRLPPVCVNVNQIKQVFVNMLLNACNAIESDGRISIQTHADEKNILIELKDNGHGIAPDDLDKIFDPFYTTNPLGRGTGLGLSIVYGIIENHGGRIDVQSELGQGTCFSIYLPRNGQVETSKK